MLIIFIAAKRLKIVITLKAETYASLLKASLIKPVPNLKLKFYVATASSEIFQHYRLELCYWVMCGQWMNDWTSGKASAELVMINYVTTERAIVPRNRKGRKMNGVQLSLLTPFLWTDASFRCTLFQLNCMKKTRTKVGHRALNSFRARQRSNKQETWRPVARYILTHF